LSTTAEIYTHAVPASQRASVEKLERTIGTTINFWLVWAGEGMSDLFVKIRHDVAFRKEVAEKAGLGFELPSKKLVVGQNGPKIENEIVLEMAATA
jgi:hypothetical protein